MWIRPVTLSLTMLVASLAPASAQDPLSAIDWLSESISKLPAPRPRASGVTDSAAVEDISVTALDSQRLDSVGLLSTATTGLPRNLWANSPSETLVRQILAADTDQLPALTDLIYVLLLAEARAPADAGPEGRLLQARIDKLLALGALDQAQALLERAGPETPALFRRWFDVALLTGTENTVCSVLSGNGGFAPSYSARIFCLARNGDWNAAALTLETGAALGFISDQEFALLSRFLDPVLFENGTRLAPPSRPSPLVFRIYEAIGEAISTNDLPRAFAQADLRFNIGWKAKIAAAERLARSGAIAPNLLLGLYTERLPAASGGVWDRVAAIQKLDEALKSGDRDAIAQALPPAWDLMSDAGLQEPFASIFAKRLMSVALDGAAGSLAFRVALLTQHYAAAADRFSAVTEDEKFLVALARGRLQTTAAPTDRARAIRDGFLAGTPPADLQRLVDDDRLGEAILAAIALFSSGAQGDLEDLATAIASLRSLGQEETARRAALQYLLIDTRG